MRVSSSDVNYVEKADIIRPVHQQNGEEMGRWDYIQTISCGSLDPVIHAWGQI